MAIKITVAAENDIQGLYGVAAAMGDSHEARYFEKCLDEQKAGNRRIFLAREDGNGISGYVQLNFRPLYPPFRRLGLPEIQDLCVIPAARRQGIGSLLVAHCETVAKEEGHSDIAISVGLHPRFGSAQRLYVQKGYVPDGAGIAYDEVTVRAGEMRAVDDLLTLKLTKAL